MEERLRPRSGSRRNALGRRLAVRLERPGQPIRQHVVLLGPLFRNHRLDRPLEVRVVPAAAGADEIDQKVGSRHGVAPGPRRRADG